LTTIAVSFPLYSIFTSEISIKGKRKINRELVFQQILQALRVRQTLNSSPIDELGEGVYEGGWWCQAKCEH